MVWALSTVLLVWILVFWGLVLHAEGVRMLPRRRSVEVERADPVRIAKLEKELGLLSALSDRDFAHQIDMAEQVPLAPNDPVVQLMASTYERAMQYTVLERGGGFYSNTDPTKSVIAEMFKVK